MTQQSLSFLSVSLLLLLLNGQLINSLDCTALHFHVVLFCCAYFCIYDDSIDSANQPDELRLTRCCVEDDNIRYKRSSYWKSGKTETVESTMIGER